MSQIASKTTQATAEWVKIFPKQATETYTSSITFIKQLTYMAVSTITYLKNLFPEECYNIVTFGGISLRILKKNCHNELGKFVTTSLTYAFEAFEKRYLCKLALCFYEGECHADNLVEYHAFEYSYTDDGVTMDVSSKKRDSARQTAQFTFDSVRERTLQLIRSCLVMVQNCQNPLPPTYDISLRLYYNEAAPNGYQPPGFLSNTEISDHLDGTANDSMTLGSVQTPFHRIIASSYMREMQSSRNAEPSQYAPMMTPGEDDNFDSVISEQRSETESIAPLVLCACDKDDDDGLTLLTCHYCGTLQHAACFGLRGGVARHCCTRCSDADPAREPTDARIAALSTKKRECLSILRRTLEWCSKLPAVGVGELMNKFRLSDVNAAKLIKLLQAHGVIEDTDNDIMSPRKIIPHQLNSAIKRYFYCEDDFVSRLLAETLSHDTPVRSDPVGDVLGPMEKISLQNATTLGKVIEPSPQESAMEDATLMQYKEAILSNQQPEDELPLSGNHNPVKDMQMIGKKGKRKAGTENLRTGVRTKRVKTKA